LEIETKESTEFAKTEQDAWNADNIAVPGCTGAVLHAQGSQRGCDIHRL